MRNDLENNLIKKNNNKTFDLYSEVLKDIPNEDISFINSMPKNMVFKCFSFNLFKKLSDNGFKPICKSIYLKKDKDLIYSTFEKTKEFMEIVTEFSNDDKSKSEYRIKKYGSDISFIERQKLKENKEKEEVDIDVK